MSLPSVSECARSETDEQPDFEEIENKSDFPGCLLDCDSDVPVSSNVGAHNLPFQRWMKFKEAFSPRFVANAVESLGYRPLHCIDPFGGSGTTALTCSFLGIRSTTIEVNPFLADLIRAKLLPSTTSEIERAYENVLSASDGLLVNIEISFRGAPKTLVEPGFGGRFVFWRDAIARILALREAINAIANENVRLTLKVLLGSVLVDASNVLVNGKGRRYRKNWAMRKITASDVDRLFARAVSRCLWDLRAAGDFERAPAAVIQGDSRQLLSEIGPTDLAIFSPPYPNSFDYTDVYNLELWVLGYLFDSTSNRALRRLTIRSHVQVGFEPGRLIGSPTLAQTMRELNCAKDQLWDRRIPGMILAYFEDLRDVLLSLRGSLLPGSRVFMAVGDSQYAGVYIDVAAAIAEILPDTGYRLVSRKAIRSMRSSAQHGGRSELVESCLILDCE